MYEGKIALVTGASRGIGRAAAEHLARKGASVVAVARSKAALDGLADAAGVHPYVLDLADLDGVAKLAEWTASKFGRLDILVGNAAVFVGHFHVQDIPLDAMQASMQVNFFSNWQLLRCCDALLRRSKAGRVVFVTAKGAYGGHPEWSAYAASKAALDRIMAAYGNENAGTALRCNSLSPGPVLTDMGVYANKSVEGLVAAENILPLFDYLLSEQLVETGRMFDYRHFKEKQFIEPWRDVIVP